MSEKGRIPVEEEATSTTRDIAESGRRLINSAIKTGTSVAALPVNFLPKESQEHFRAAGRELSLGIAAIVRSVADTVDKMSK